MKDPMVQHAKLMRHAKRTGAIQSGETLATWQDKARDKLGELLGIPFERSDSTFCVESQTVCEGYDEYRMSLRTESCFETVACLRIPTHVPRPMPVIICLQGHSKGMHISLGEAKYEGDEQTICGGDRDFARQIVNRGYAALALEQRAFGECGGTPEGPDCYQSAMSALLIGRTLIGERVWDVSRAIDMLEAHFPQINAARIAVMGNSGGGTTAIYAAAMDIRIAAAMPSCAFSGFAASIGLQKHCACNYIPNILRYYDMGDVAGLIAPRSLVVINGKEDTIFPIDAAVAEFAVTQRYYALADAADKCRHLIGPEGHRFYAALGWPVFDEVTGWRKSVNG